ncbi:MAG: hypothetical protein QOI82_417 [Actinomycetota bacterium]|jgi:hypothetical protein|nr:hypothetical protein [Actinomycetota bacterium]
MRRIVVVVPVLVLLAGCSAGGESGASSSAAMSKSDGAKRAPVAGLPAAAHAAVDTAAKPVAVPRSLVRTGALEVRVADVKTSAAAAEQLVADAGGEVVDEQLDLHSAHPTASLTLHVPPPRLARTLSRLSDLGKEQSRQLGTEDVTDQVVDLDSRLATQSSSVVRVRALMDRAHSLTDVVRIESELSRREADLESLQARVRALSGQVAMSEITLQLTTQNAKPKIATTVGFSSGLHGGWRTFTATARVSAATFGALLPFLPLVFAALWGAWWWRRRVSAA